jgi:catechol 2,3-dioxygenase-like lactoylglutathione lyase family enzyme
LQTQLGHLVFGAQPGNLPFYKDLFTFLGWIVIYDSPEMFGVGDKNQVSVWFGPPLKNTSNDYDGPGLNHIAIGTATQADVDAAEKYLTGKGIAMLFETPRHRPEFSSEPNTYYQIIFESPDRILFEVVYTGPK